MDRKNYLISVFAEKLIESCPLTTKKIKGACPWLDELGVARELLATCCCGETPRWGEFQFTPEREHLRRALRLAGE
jgi:hypothetical protein